MMQIIPGMLLLITSAIGAVTSQASEIDLIVSADHVITMDSQHRQLDQGALAIDDGVIVAIDHKDIVSARYSARRTIAGENRLLMPGLINGHTHSAMVLFRGIADDLDLMEWLNDYIFPAEIRFVNESFVRVGTQLACLEMIKTGTTTFVDMYFHPKEIAGVVEACGMRAVIAAAVIEQQSGYAQNFDDAMQKAESFISEWKGRNPRITPAIAAHAPYTISPPNLRIIRERATALGVGVSIHLSESAAELAIVSERYGETSINLLEQIGFLSGPTIAAHVVVPTPSEVQILQRRQVGAIHNPTSNLKIAVGISPVPEMLAAGVNVGLGTDGAASNNDLDMWEEIKLAALIHKGRLLDPKVMPAISALEIATRTGAAAIGLDDQVGSLEVGKRADVIQLSLDAAHLTPRYDAVSHLVYAADSQDVRTVIVDGQVIMEERQVLTLNEVAIKRKAREIARAVSLTIHDRD